MMFGLAAVSLIVYVIGSIRNRRIVVNYSKMVKEEASLYCTFTGFRIFSRGFEALCQLRDDRVFSKVNIRFLPARRENFMYYLLNFLVRDHDKIIFWSLLNDEAPITLNIVNNNSMKIVEKFKNSDLRRIELNDAGFTVFTDSVEKAEKIVRRIHSQLFQVRDSTNLVTINRMNDWVRVVGVMRENSVKNTLNLLVRLGEVMKSLK